MVHPGRAKRPYKPRSKLPVEKELNTALGAKVREVRLARGLSMEELGERIGVTYQQMQKYEKGVNRISIGKLVLICQALRVELSDLVEDLDLKKAQGGGSPKDTRFKAAPQEVLRTASFLANIEDPLVRKSFRALSKALIEVKS